MLRQPLSPHSTVSPGLGLDLAQDIKTMPLMMEMAVVGRCVKGTVVGDREENKLMEKFTR